MLYAVFCFFKQKTAYEMRISDWSSDVCSSDLRNNPSCSGLSRASRATASSLALDPRLKAEGDERSNWKRAWQLAVSHAAHAEVLHLEEFLDAVLGAFAADAGFLHAAEGRDLGGDEAGRSEEHTSELQSLMRITYAVFCLNKKRIQHNI